MLGKSFAKIGRLVGNLRRGDARDRDFFDEYMRRQKHEATHGATRTASMDQCYGSSVAMSNQYRLFDRKSIEQLGQRNQRFLMHIAHRTRSCNDSELPYP